MSERNMQRSFQENILVRVPNWIGDAVMCTPALMDLREHFPRAKITILARPTIGEMLKGHPAVDGVIMYSRGGQRKSLLNLCSLIACIRRKQFDQAVLFQNAFEAAFITWAAGIPSRTGYATDGRSGLLTCSISKPNIPNVHHTHYYQHLVSSFTCYPGKNRVPQLFLDAEAKKTCVQRFPEVFSLKDHVLIGINPGSVYGSAKRWMPERFAETGDRLVERLTGEQPGTSLVRCVLLGGKGEESLGSDIGRRMQYKPIGLSGRTTIQELMGVLTRCSVLVTNDTGPMHVAQALGIPVAAIFGPTDPRATGPNDALSAVAKSSPRCAPCFLRACPIDHRCMTQVSVDRVVEVALTQLRLVIDRETVCEAMLDE